MSAGYFFNGRQWISPATMSMVDDSAMVSQSLSVGNVAAFVGQSTGGQPNTPLVFGSPAQAQATLVSGELLQAVLKAFNPSNETGGPSTVVAIRVNPAVQSSLVVNDASAAPSINLSSADYGLRTNQIKVSFAAGSSQGVHATTQLGKTVYSQDNLYAAPFSVQYTGALASAALSINNATVTLEAPLGTIVAAINLATFPTVQQLVDNINSYANFTAAVLGGAGPQPTLNGLDSVTRQDIKTVPYAVTATLQAVIDWLNSPAQALVVATRANGAGQPPAPMSFTYLAGGSDGITTNQNWSNAFAALQTRSVQWLTPVTSNLAVIAMSDAHVQYMSTVGRSERRAICGMALGTTDAQAIAAAMAINSDRTSLVHIGYYGYDLTGQLTGLQLYAPYQAAAAVAGAFSGLNPGTPMTNKALAFSGLERVLLNPTNTDPLIQGGVLCIESTPNGYKVVQSVSTWLVNNNYDKVEQSVGWALDFTVQNVRKALDILRGSKNTPITMSRAVSITESQLRLLATPEPRGPGVLTGDAENPAYQGITASTVADALAVSFQCSPVLGVNFIPVTVFSVPFSGTATA
ncbi:MAG TPA: hypothetical protein VF472_07360 [Burkholderiaceae bacterium]